MIGSGYRIPASKLILSLAPGGVKRSVVPAENEAEAKLISGIEVVGLRTLPQGCVDNAKRKMYDYVTGKW